LLISLSRLSPAEQRPLLRQMCQSDLYFLLCYVLKRRDLENDWLFARCREVQSEPDGRIDLWAREHYKSSIITLGLTLLAILNDPEITVGVFSHTRPIAKGFLRQIKRELEANNELKFLFPDILFDNPQKDSPKWSEDDGLIVKRKTNPKESTVEAHGLVDGQPTSKHFKLMVYDDVVTRESVTSPEQIAKVTEAWELSRSLTSEGGRTRYIGTRYAFNDTYHTIMQRNAAIPRIYAATVDGTADGEPVLMTRERLQEKRREQGPYTFASQMLLNPIAEEKQSFRPDWLIRADSDGGGMNKYIVVDPASAKKKSSDYTSMFVIGLSSDQNYYVLDMIRDRLSLTERADAVFSLHKRWKPLRVGYEKYGMQADIEHLRDRQRRENYRFEIVELGGSMPKIDRIRRLVPLFEQGRMFFPETCFKTNYEGKMQELVQIFLHEEFAPFPVGMHDDMLDSLARILDPEMFVLWPKATPVVEDRYARAFNKAKARNGTSWMSA
jgi:predicted phage terminase large subunit-like protein